MAIAKKNDLRGFFRKLLRPLGNFQSQTAFMSKAPLI